MQPWEHPKNQDVFRFHREVSRNPVKYEQQQNLSIGLSWMNS
jgi:hypothetical protein